MDAEERRQQNPFVYGQRRTKVSSGWKEDSGIDSNVSAYRELQRFRSWLRWIAVDRSSRRQSFLCWSLFLILAIAVPIPAHLFFSGDRHPYDLVVQISLTAAAALSFLCLLRFFRRHGLQRFLFLDRICEESEKVRDRYAQQLSGSFKILSYFVLPYFIAESSYKIWWYCSVGSHITFLGNKHLGNTIACILELCSWLYRASIFFVVCVLFRLTCHLQILQLQDFNGVFEKESNVAAVLKEHLRIRRQLKVISHRFRVFIVLALIFVTASQLASLLIITRSHADFNIFKAGKLTLCSMCLVTGLLICLRSAAKITHMAQAVTTHAAKWHACATIGSSERVEAESSIQVTSLSRTFPIDFDSEEDAVDQEDEDDTKIFLPHAHTISFQRRQALVSYLENNRAGITVFGFVLDRAWLHTIFGIELSLVLWLLKLTIGIS